MTTEAFIEAIKEPEQWEAFDPCEGDRGEWFGSSEWTNWSAYQLSGTKFRSTSAPAIDPPAEMDAERSTGWLLENPRRRVLDRNNVVWCADNTGKLPNTAEPYTPLVPLTRGQLAEIEQRDIKFDELGLEVAGLKSELRTALGSQKAALAALEQERKQNKTLRLALEDLLNMVHCEAAQNAERVLSETAGKESGG
jgi:hypothetical protein